MFFFFLPSFLLTGWTDTPSCAAEHTIPALVRYLLSRLQLLQDDADVGAVFHPGAGVRCAGAGLTLDCRSGLRLDQGWEEGQMLTVLSSALLVLFSLGANLTQDFGL